MSPCQGKVLLEMKYEDLGGSYKGLEQWVLYLEPIDLKKSGSYDVYCDNYITLAGKKSRYERNPTAGVFTCKYLQFDP